MSLSAAASRIPGIATARRYQRGWLRTDITAGLVVSALLVPTGMGYAAAAGLPAHMGMYATIVPMLVYALVGPSRILVVVPSSALAPLIAAAVVPLAAAGDPSRAVALAGLLALIVGILLLFSGILRLGFITELLSNPIRVGFLNAIALIVIASEVPHLLGANTRPADLFTNLRNAADAVRGGALGSLAFLLGGATLILIVVMQVLWPRVPGILVGVVVATGVTAAFGLGDKLETVGALPSGLPGPALGGLAWSDVATLLGPAVAIAIIGFADTSVVSRAFSSERGEDVNGSSEMRALGVANLAAGVTGGFPVCGSGSRTPVVQRAGAHTQLAGVVGALTVLAFLLLAPGATGNLPRSALSAVVIVAASAQFKLAKVRHLWQVAKIEFGLCIAASVAVILAGVLRGVLIAIALSLMALVIQAWRPHRAELVEVPGIAGYHDSARHPEGHRIRGLLLARFDAPLFFANGSILTGYVRALVQERSDRVEWVVLVAQPITDLDTTSVEEIERLDEYLSHNGIRFVFAALEGQERDKLLRMQSADRFHRERFYPTTRAAVIAFRHRHDTGITQRTIRARPDISPTGTTGRSARRRPRPVPGARHLRRRR